MQQELCLFRIPQRWTVLSSQIPSTRSVEVSRPETKKNDTAPGPRMSSDLWQRPLLLFHILCWCCGCFRGYDRPLLALRPLRLFHILLMLWQLSRLSHWPLLALRLRCTSAIVTVTSDDGACASGTLPVCHSQGGLLKHNHKRGIQANRSRPSFDIHTNEGMTSLALESTAPLLGDEGTDFPFGLGETMMATNFCARCFETVVAVPSRHQSRYSTVVTNAVNAAMWFKTHGVTQDKEGTAWWLNSGLSLLLKLTLFRQRDK